MTDEFAISSSWVLQLLHWLAGIVVLAESLDKLQRTAHGALRRAPDTPGAHHKPGARRWPGCCWPWLGGWGGRADHAAHAPGAARAAKRLRDVRETLHNSLVCVNGVSPA